MIFRDTELAGAYVIDLEKREDERGYFARVWCERELADRGLVNRIAQINSGFSPRAGTLRGLHFQLPPHAEVKVVRCTRGAAYDVIVDLRRESPTFRRWFGLEMTADDGRLLYVPEGCAHGYLTLVENTELSYLTSRPYAPDAARGVRYDDPGLRIRWPERVSVISKADASWPDFG